MASRATLVALCLLAVAAGALGEKYWWGSRNTHPKDRKAFVQTYVRTEGDRADSKIIAVGAMYTRRMLDKAVYLPIKNTDWLIVPPNPAGWPGYKHNITVNDGGQFDMDVPAVAGNPFLYLRSIYLGKGVLITSPPFSGIWDTAHWDQHWHLHPKEEWVPLFEDKNGKPLESSKGPCGFPAYSWTSSIDLFIKGHKPVAEKCYPPAPFVNQADFIWRHGQHIYDFTGPEYNPQGVGKFNTSVLYGIFDGNVHFFHQKVSNLWMQQDATETPQCRTFSIPPGAPVARKYPTKYCMQKRKLRGEDAVVVEMLDWVDVPKVDCVVSATNPATPRSLILKPFLALVPQICQDALNKQNAAYAIGTA